jgi:hypothetical protein
MDALSSHWQDLYAVRGCGGLQKAADCVADLVQGIESRREGRVPAGGESLSDPIEIAEVEAAVRKLGLGRMVGPDLVRGEYLRGLYREEMVLDTDGRMRIKHVYDTQPGDVIHDLCVGMLVGVGSGGTYSRRP